MDMPALKDTLAEHGWPLLVSAVLIAVTATYLQSPTWKLRAIPTVGGSSLPLLSYLGARRYFKNAQEWYREGYAQYRGGFFKIPTMDRWMVVATGPDLIKQIASMPDDKMSFMDASEEIMGFDHLGLGPVFKDAYHIEVVRRDLTRSLVALFPDIYDEISNAFEDYVPSTENWIAISAYDVATQIVARASNRLIVGLPLCRNEEYLKRCIMYTLDLNDSSQAVTKYPWYLKPLIAPFVNKLPAIENKALTILSPEINKRIALWKEYGRDYPDKPNDFLEWMLNMVFERNEEDLAMQLVRRILHINFAAIHTSSSTFTHCLFTLATHPDWISPLREEIESVVAEEGMTKSAMQKMVKLDSFFREANRTNTITGEVLTRVALKPITFADGTYISAGTFVTVPTMPHQLDERNYDNATDTQPFRFEHVEEDAIRKSFTTSDPQYMAFGHGKHACPGRFFAGNELKSMMAHLLLNYDIQAEEPGVRPENVLMGSTIMPNMQAKILVRKRMN